MRTIGKVKILTPPRPRFESDRGKAFSRRSLSYEKVSHTMPWIVVLLRSVVILIFAHVQPLCAGGQKDLALSPPVHKAFQS